MNVIRNEKIVYFDVDNTLIYRVEKSEIELDYYGNLWYIEPHEKHIEFLISLKSRGYYIIVHSANGWEHALKTINILNLGNFVDSVQTKPLKYVDDLTVDEWFGPRIFINK